MVPGHHLTSYKSFVVGFIVVLVCGLLLWHVGQSGVESADAAEPSVWGDVDCSGSVDSLDVILILRSAASLPVSVPDGCPGIGTTTALTQSVSESETWGDSDCSGFVDGVDGLDTLLYLASVPVNATGSCLQIGASISTQPSPSHKVILYITGIASTGDCNTPGTLIAPETYQGDSGWGWIDAPLFDAGARDSLEYIYRDGDDAAPDCSSDPQATFESKDACWSIDDYSSLSPSLKGQARKLADFLEGYLTAHPNAEVSIVAHSQGGVLATYAIVHYRNDGHHPNISKVKTIVTLDSPLGGLPALVPSSFLGCPLSLDTRYDSLADMVDGWSVINEIKSAKSTSISTRLFTVDEQGGFSGTSPEFQIPDAETRLTGWELGHISVHTGSHATLANGSGDSVQTQRVVSFIECAIFGPKPGQSANCEDPTYTIGGTVFIDANGNGTRDQGESPSINATVQLAGVASTTTDILGHYSFTGITGATYSVQLTIPSSYQPTTPDLVNVSVPPDATVDFGIKLLTGSNRPPNPPSPYFPPDGSTIYMDNQPDMCWNGNGDPDGDAVEYMLVVSKMPVNGDTNNFEFGWSSNNCLVDLTPLADFLSGLGMDSGTFAWHVVARDPSGLLSDWSPCWSSGVDCYGNPWWLNFTLVIGQPLQSPEPPSGLQATALDPYSIQLNWFDNSSNEDGFEITDNVTSVFVAANSEEYVWGGLQPNSYKCFKIRAYNAAGNSDWEPPVPPYYVCTGTPNPLKAEITSPAPGTTFSGSSVTFTRNDGIGVDSFWLGVSSGTACGSGDIFWNFFPDNSITINNIPTDGREICVRLVSFINGAWDGYNDYTYYAATQGTSNTISGTVFFDANRNGLHDSDESGVPWGGGWFVVELTSMPGEPYFYETQAIEAGGNYTFTDLPPENYWVLLRVCTTWWWEYTTPDRILNIGIPPNGIADFGVYPLTDPPQCSS